MALQQLRSGDRDTIVTIAHRHGVTSVKVFGSFVRDEPGLTATSTPD
jgi:predicted nucleotidyltransferase